MSCPKREVKFGILSQQANRPTPPFCFTFTIAFIAYMYLAFYLFANNFEKDPASYILHFGFIAKIVKIGPPQYVFCVLVHFGNSFKTFFCLLQFWRDVGTGQGHGQFHILFLFFVSSMFSISLCSLLGYHIHLVLNNRTTLEAFRF